MMMFGNRSLGLHLLRGLTGFGALYLALAGYPVFGWPALLLIGVAVWLLKGCPVCWTIGLFETLAHTVFARISPEPLELMRGEATAVRPRRASNCSR